MQVNRVAPQLARLGEAQKAVQQLGQSLRLVVDRGHETCPILALGVREQPQVAAHGGEGVAQLVGHPRRQLAKSRHLLTLGKSALERLQCRAVGEEKNLSLGLPVGRQQREAPCLDHAITQPPALLAACQRCGERTTDRQIGDQLHGRGVGGPHRTPKIGDRHSGG